MAKLRACIVLLFCAAAISAPAQTFTILASFDGTSGGRPAYGSLVQGFDGNLFGTATLGGSGSACTNDQGCGTVFRITPSGELTTLYNFCQLAQCADGSTPYGQLLLAVDGNFYGTTYQGGANNSGTIFRITPSGSLTTLHSFCSATLCADGTFPAAPLIQARDGNLYGTASFGGVAYGGTAFKITSDGEFTSLYSFCINEDSCPDGYGPNALVQAENGDLYGTTSQGGTGQVLCSNIGCGTVFKITTTGELTTIYSFSLPIGAYPYSGLVETKGALYGTTFAGGGTKTECEQQGCGTVFKITPEGAFTLLDKFGSTGSNSPYAGLTEGSDGNLYGTSFGYVFGAGSLFEMTTAGALTTLFNFMNTPTSRPETNLYQATDGAFYGSTTEGGLTGYSLGVVFRRDAGLGPFVQALPAAQSVNKPVVILGTHLRGASSVSFNGTGAAFTLVSDTEITTSVPTGATTGFITVTMPSGTLKSNKPFRVIP